VPDGVRVEVRGFAELAAGSEQLAANIERASNDAFLAVAEESARRTRSALHHDTGRTAASVVTRQTPEGAVVGYGDGVPYAQYEEYGGRGWPRSPNGNFLYPSAYLGAERQLIEAGMRTADKEIGAMNWPSP
jgi:hypothetical protein